MEDSSKKPDYTHRTREDDIRRCMEDDTLISEEEWHEMLKRKGSKHVHGTLEHSIIILNPHPELVRKLREYKLRKSSQLNTQKEDPESSLPLD